MKDDHQKLVPDYSTPAAFRRESDPTFMLLLGGIGLGVIISVIVNLATESIVGNEPNARESQHLAAYVFAVLGLLVTSLAVVANATRHWLRSVVYGMLLPIAASGLLAWGFVHYWTPG